MRIVLAVWMLLAALPASAQILGAWSAESYALKDGSEYPVSGLILFTESDWSTLFFVKDDDGNDRRGSAEAGSYTLQGNRLTFTHTFHMSTGEAVGSLAASPLRMGERDAAEAVTEPCDVDVSEDSMTIHFPSGNKMVFTKSSGF